MKTIFRRCALLLAGGTALGAAAWAGVTSKPQMLRAVPSEDFYVPLQLQTSAGESIAGINGEMLYDPAYFSNPVVQAGEGVFGFIGLGNVVAPGKLRFVVYSDPTKAADLGTTTMFVKLTPAANLPIDGSTTITFLNGPVDPNDPDKGGESAVSTTAGVSVPSVTFTTIQVALNLNAAADWVLYP